MARHTQVWRTQTCFVDTPRHRGHNDGVVSQYSVNGSKMPDMTLTAQCQAAQDHIRAGELEQAASVCQRILSAFPRYARVYAIMGRIYLLLGEHEEAANLFRRVLSVDPEDTVSYASLGLIYAERGLLEEAIWQLERAIELSPGNREIRLELCGLYAERDGVDDNTVRVKPSAGALVRCYLRGMIYPKAIGEARELLSGAPEQLDIRVALLEAFWRARRYDEAEVVAQGILESLPNCLKANLVLGSLWLNGDRDDDARRHLHLAQELDPNNALAQELFGARSPLPPRVARLPLDEKVEPLDLPYLVDDQEIIDGDVPAGAASADDDTGEVLTIDSIEANDTHKLEPQDAYVEDAPIEAEPEPEPVLSADERLRLARGHLVAGDLASAMGHYAWLLLNAPDQQGEVRADLDALRASRNPVFKIDNPES